MARSESEDSLSAPATKVCAMATVRRPAEARSAIDSRTRDIAAETTSCWVRASLGAQGRWRTSSGCR